MSSNKKQWSSPMPDNRPDRTLMRFQDVTSDTEILLMGGLGEDYEGVSYDILTTSPTIGTLCMDTFSNYPDAIKKYGEYVRDYAVATLTQPIGAPKDFS